jgi:hypothetical protein
VIGAPGAYAQTSHHSSSSTSATSGKVSVVVFGDSTAFTLAYTLGVGPLPSKLHYSLEDNGHIGCGLPQSIPFRSGGVVYGPTRVCTSSTTPLPNTPLQDQPLAVQWEAALTKYHPNVVVLLSGRWQVQDFLYDGAWTNILNPIIAAIVKQELESASDLFTSAGTNVVFLTSPCVADQPLQPDGSLGGRDPARIAAYNALVRQVAAEHPTTDSVVDLDALVCPGGRFTATYKGKTIRTSPDGIHFTDQAGLVLGRALMPPILSAGRQQMARVSTAGSRAARRSGS